MKYICRIMVLLLLLLLLPYRAQASETGVEVGGVHILKTDVTGKPLEGAIFQLVRELQPGETAGEQLEKKIMKISGENRLVSVQVFWPEREMTGMRQSSITTNHRGEAAIYGLPYGTYYLVESEAPDGYNRITEPIRLSIHRYSHLNQEDNVVDDDGKLIDNTLHIINVRYTLPDTGKWGRVQLAAAATGILFSSIALILLNRKRYRS